jgi:hypothetical protein
VKSSFEQLVLQVEALNSKEKNDDYFNLVGYLWDAARCRKTNMIEPVSRRILNDFLDELNRDYEGKLKVILNNCGWTEQQFFEAISVQISKSGKNVQS